MKSFQQKNCYVTLELCIYFLIPINNNIKNTPKIYLRSKQKEYLMESLYYSEENDEDQFIETNSANNASTQIKLKLLSYNTRAIYVHLQESCREKVNYQKLEECPTNEYQSLLPTVLWDSKKEIEGLCAEEIKNNIFRSVCENICKLDQIMLNEEFQL